MATRLIRFGLLGVFLFLSSTLAGCPDRKGACIDACEPKEEAIEACAKAASREICEKNMKDPKKISDCKAQCEQMF